MFCMKKIKYFTLIELLVVVAIIGILMSILMSSLSKAREEAKIALCLSNNRQLAVAQITYCSDESGFFPPTSGPGYSQWNWGWAGNTDYWGGNKVTDRPLNVYLTGDLNEDTEIKTLECPSDSSPWHSAPDGGEYSWYRMYGTSYSINKAPHQNALGRPSGPKTLSNVIETSKMIMTTENDANI